MKINAGSSQKVLWYLVPLLLLGFPTGVYLTTSLTNKIFKEYPLMKESDSIDAIIIKHSHYKGTTLIETKSGLKLSIRAYNYQIKPSPMFEHIDIGDSISRELNNEKIFLYKKNSDKVLEFNVRWLK